VPSTRRTQAAGMNTPSTIYGAQYVPTVSRIVVHALLMMQRWIPAFAGMTEGGGNDTFLVAPAEAGVHASNQAGMTEARDYGSK